MKPGITVVIPSFPSRYDLLGRAVASATNQTLPPEQVIVVVDNKQEGAAVTRTRGLMQVETEWTAFLDDDDYFLPEHLEKLTKMAKESKADLVFPWFTVIGSGSDPFPMNEKREWDRADPHQTTITFLVRTEAAQKVGGFIEQDGDIDPAGEDVGTDAQGHRAGEDFRFVLRLHDAGYKIKKLHERTWVWVHHSKNSMGMPSRRG